MKKKLYYKDVAESVINEGWHWNVDESKSMNSHIATLDDSIICAVLLADIAKSLRVLRCNNFVDIPNRLDAIRVASQGLRRESRSRRKKA